MNYNNQISIELSTNNIAYEILEKEIEDLMIKNEELNEIIKKQTIELEIIKRELANFKKKNDIRKSTPVEENYQDMISLRSFVKQKLYK